MRDAGRRTRHPDSESGRALPRKHGTAVPPHSGDATSGRKPDHYAGLWITEKAGRVRGNDSVGGTPTDAVGTTALLGSMEFCSRRIAATLHGGATDAF
jgi:hypothetical protein